MQQADTEERIDRFLRSIQPYSFAFLNIIGQDTLKSWTPALTFATAGNLSVTYTTQVGRYVKVGLLVYATFNVVTASFSHTSASGALHITGIPFTSSSLTSVFGEGTCRWQGITKANYTDIDSAIAANDNKIQLTASGSGQNIAVIAAADMPTGGSVILRGNILYYANK